ncbi:hypothetical protein B0H21DRAFT_744960 [Amylocystis lapponica]|nr:hypothetical protein B0H21DRAFT_744960 [Amylocystis lapponica]
MSTEVPPNEQHIDKGKARARSPDPDESTPLLGPAAGPVILGDDPEDVPYARRLYSRLVTVFVISLSLCIILFLILLLVAFSCRSRASNISPDEVLQHALVVRGPDRVDVLNTTGDGGIWMRVHCRMGLDAGGLVGVKTAEGDNFMQDWWKSMGRWGIRQLDRVSVNLTSIVVSPENHPSQILTTIVLPPLEMPLTANPPPDTTWLTKVALPVLIRPTKDLSVLMRFVRDSWKEGKIDVRAVVGQAAVRGGGLEEGGWRSVLSVLHSDIQTAVHIQIPKLPGLPTPGHNQPLPVFSELVTLQSFLITSDSDTLFISAIATVVNPVPLPFAFDFTPPIIPFTIFLPRVNATDSTPPVQVASVHTHPFSLTYPNITLSISGSVLPLSLDASPTISTFLGNYVSARDSDIIVSSPLFPDVTVDAKFPAPRPKPNILRNVTIHDMRIRATGNTMLASGTIFAHVVLPKGIEVAVDVTCVFPDVLVFDGPVPEPAGTALPASIGFSALLTQGDPPNPPLPDPLPDRAFAHIRPDDWLPAESEPCEGAPGDGSAVEVTAKIVDVPLQVLPGREREFSNFVTKVIFGPQGALAGVQGVAAVSVRVQGLPFENGKDGEMELTGLPFQGSVLIGKRAMLESAA